MSLYSIEDTTLTALGDAVRSKVAPGVINFQEESSVDLGYYTNKIIISTENQAPLYRYELINGFVDGSMVENSFYIQDKDRNNIYQEPYPNTKPIRTEHFPIILTIPSPSITIHFVTNYSSVHCRFDVIITPLDENGNEFKYTPLEMVDKVNEFVVVPNEGLIFKGTQMLYTFANNKNQWLIDIAGNKIKTENLTTLNYAFYANNLIDEVPFIINANPNHTSFTLNSTFKDSSIKSLPKMYNVDLGQMTEMCSGATMLRDIPDDWCETWKWTYAHGSQSYSGGKVFYNCYSLRKLPISLCENIMNRASSTYCNFAYCFPRCYSLDEITHMGTIGDVFVLSSNVFTSHIDSCYRLKDYIFKLNDDNTPQIVKWKKQAMDFSTAGYANVVSYILDYNSGITADKEVKDDATYQALKNDPDWFSCDINYSRYNHDSAVRTINSLPDASAYLATQTGTSNNNTIKFKGQAGALTDGGAINTLTEEEIAVATAKGWTVSLV